MSDQRSAPDDDITSIEDYALIGNCRTAALVSRDGSIDWLCFPRFDSPSVFGAILDTEHGGRFRIRPTGSFRTERRYQPDTNILETVFHTPGGSCIVRDCFTVRSEEAKRRTLSPEHEVLREIEGLTGEVELEIHYDPRSDYGRERPALRQRGELGYWCRSGGAALILHGDLPLELIDNRRSLAGRVSVRHGERRYLACSYQRDAPAVLHPLGAAARERITETADWWRTWASRCTYRGPYREAVLRSALVLKMMAYAPSGALIAAPTTSLPERLGGVRNWDYRYCWLRDASFTLHALFALGYDEEAEAFLHWMLHATRLTWPELRVLYDIFGEAHLPERELSHLAGHAGSRPVRVGNDAQGQLQLDVYGEVIDAAATFAARGGRFDRGVAKLLDQLGRTVCRRWREPDEGIWEGRSGRQHNTHSKVLCWVALDRLITLHVSGCIQVAVDLFREQREAIRAEIEARGFNKRLGSYTRTFDGDDLDASLLTLPLYGYVAGTQPRMRSTCARIREQLGQGCLLYRYTAGTDDGLPTGEGAFGICSFWAVECLAHGGERDTATAVFAEMLTYANDLGLFGEEIDPETGAALGNFPQAFTHIGLINAALTLAACQTGSGRPAEQSTAQPGPEEPDELG